MLASLDNSVPTGYKAANVARRFASLFRAVPCSHRREGTKHKVALRMTRGPTNSCIDFHCDGGYATSTTQIPLNPISEYEGGKLYFFVNDRLQGVPRPPGSVVSHPPKVLHGVASVTLGTRKSLFIVDHMNGLGDVGVVEMTSSDVVSFLAQRASRNV